MSVQFSGVQSLNGLQTFTLFTAPAAGSYFINGQLSLPQLVTDGLASAVVATVTNSTGPTTVYTGTAGASGFQIPQTTCAAGDVISVTLSSAAACDKVTNAVSGQVTFGNAF